MMADRPAQDPAPVTGKAALELIEGEKLGTARYVVAAEYPKPVPGSIFEAIYRTLAGGPMSGNQIADRLDGFRRPRTDEVMPAYKIRGKLRVLVREERIHVVVALQPIVFNLRARHADQKALDRLREHTGERTRSKACWRAIRGFPDVERRLRASERENTLLHDALARVLEAASVECQAAEERRRAVAYAARMPGRNPEVPPAHVQVERTSTTTAETER